MPNQRIVISKAAYNKAPNAKVLNGLLNSKEEASLKSNSPEKIINKKGDIGKNSGMNTQPKSNKADATQVALDVSRDLDSDERTSSLIVTTPNSPVISKLNPNVKEFVPRIAVSNTTGTCSYSNKNVEIANYKLDNNSDAVKNVEVFYKDRSKDDKKEIAMMLKKQIPAKNNTFEEQRKTNLAIVKLLKLYAKPEEERPLKLLPPEFFEKSTKTDLEINKTNVTSKSDCPIKRMALLHCVGDVGKNETFAEETKTSLPEALRRPEKELNNIDLSNNYTYQECDNLTSVLTDKNIILPEDKDNENMNETIQLTPDMAKFDLNESPDLEKPLDPNMKESIDKVNNWLDDKPVVPICDINKIDLVKEKVSPVLSLGAVAYKRKDLASCKSPSEIISKKQFRSIGEYKPSTYAEELHKKFTEKSKTTAPAPVLNIWEKLEADLKKKDTLVNKHNKKA